MKSKKYPILHLPNWFDEQSEFETPFKGYLGNVEVELENGNRYKVFFIDPVRLQQDLSQEISLGRPYYAEAGMIVIPKVTLENVREVINSLWKESFFEGLKPL